MPAATSVNEVDRTVQNLIHSPRTTDQVVTCRVRDGGDVDDVGEVRVLGVVEVARAAVGVEVEVGVGVEVEAGVGVGVEVVSVVFM
ncbi:MAG: hypothetical protein AAGG08_21300 [Actinomycetota bacterium]